MQLGLAPARLQRIGIRDRTGQTLLEYTTCMRMEKAKVILTSTKLQLKAVAEEVGYYNVSSFIRRFKQLVGVTPGEYRSNRPAAELSSGMDDAAQS